jgi:hypothetical protein
MWLIKMTYYSDGIYYDERDVWGNDGPEPICTGCGKPGCETVCPNCWYCRHHVGSGCECGYDEDDDNQEDVS